MIFFCSFRQYGFSGCGGGEDWFLSAYVVSDSGRAHCGHVFRVSVGDVVRGNMTRQPNGDWLVTAENLSARNQVPWVDRGQVMDAPRMTMIVCDGV